MSKLKLRLNDSDLKAIQVLLLASIRDNPITDLRANPSDYLIVAELSAIFNKVEVKVRDLEWFGSTRSTVGKVVTLTLTRPEAVSLYILLTSQGETVEQIGDTGPILPFEKGAMALEPLTYETTILQQIIHTIHRTYFI